MAMEQAKRRAERISGVPNVTYDLLAVLYNKREGIAAMEEYRLDARDAGDQEADALFADLQRSARGDADRLRALLAPRLQGGAPWVATPAGQVVPPPGQAGAAEAGGQ